MKGLVYMLSEEKTYRKVQIEIRRARKLNGADHEGDGSDFPLDKLEKKEYTKLKVNQTFGNDKMLAHRNSRYAYGISEGPVT